MGFLYFILFYVEHNILNDILHDQNVLQNVIVLETRKIDNQH